MSIEIRVYSDFVCPFCYLAEPALSELAKAHGAMIDWRAFELRPEPYPTLRPEDPYLPAIWERLVYPRAKQVGICIRLPTISPQPRSRKAFELLVHARKKGLAHAWSMVVFKAFFEEDRDIGDEDTLVKLAMAVGLDPDEARLILAEGRYAEEHEAALAEARAVGIKVVPTVVIGGAVFAGMPHSSELATAIEHAVAGR